MRYGLRLDLRSASLRMTVLAALAFNIRTLCEVGHTYHCKESKSLPALRMTAHFATEVEEIWLGAQTA